MLFLLFIRAFLTFLCVFDFFTVYLILIFSILLLLVLMSICLSHVTSKLIYESICITVHYEDYENANEDMKTRIMKTQTRI